MREKERERERNREREREEIERLQETDIASYAVWNSAHRTRSCPGCVLTRHV